MIKLLRLLLIGVLLTFPLVGSSPVVKVNTADPNFCLFKNPLCFYTMDVLRYMQVLHQKQQYDQMATFFFGPMKQELGKKKLAAKLADQDFGYALKRVGIKEGTAKSWSLTYQRTILGT